MCEDCSGCSVILWHGCFISSYSIKIQKLTQLKRLELLLNCTFLRSSVLYLWQSAPFPKALTVHSVVFAAVPVGGILAALAGAAAAASAEETCNPISHLQCMCYLHPLYFVRHSPSASYKVLVFFWLCSAPDKCSLVSTKSSAFFV